MQPLNIILCSLALLGLEAASAAPTERSERYKTYVGAETPAKALMDIAKEYSMGPWPLEVVSEFKQGQRSVGETFFSERAQHLYQVGLSLTYKGDNDAARILMGALEAEPENLKILTCLAKAYLSQKSCAKAEEILRKITKNFFLLEENYILGGQLLVCKNNMDKLIEHVVPAENLLPPFRTYAMILSLRAAEANRDIGLIKTIALELNKSDPQMPEAYYWLWKYETKPSSRKEYAERYQALCQNLTAKEKKRLYLEPNLCSSTEEVRGAL